VSGLASAIAAARAALDRETVTWAVVPGTAAVLVTALFVVPNYVRALEMQDEAQRLEAVAGENISQRNNLQLLERSVAALRDETARRCRPMGEGIGNDRLLASITRPTDGTDVSGAGALRREVSVEMTASFESAFGVLEAAEGVDQLVAPRVVEIAVLHGPIEQASAGNAAVRATMVFDEWFEAPKAEQRKEAAR
jgi:hypothetical protein